MTIPGIQQRLRCIRRNSSQSDQTGNSFLRIRAQVLIFQTMCTWRRATWYVRVSLPCITMNEENQHLAKAAWAPAPAKPSQTQPKPTQGLSHMGTCASSAKPNLAKTHPRLRPSGHLRQLNQAKPNQNLPKASAKWAPAPAKPSQT